MLIEGGVWLGPSERGAFGFSNEKSLMYCAITLSCGCGRSPPLVAMVIETLRPQKPQARPHPARLANIGGRREQGILVAWWRPRWAALVAASGHGERPVRG